MNLISQYPFGYYLLCILLGIVYSYLLYKNDRKLEDFSRSLIILLFTLRLLAVSFIAMLLLAPLLRYVNRSVEKPILVFALDRSASMLQNSSTISNYDSIATYLNNELSKNYETAIFGFDEQLYPLEEIDSFSGHVTNYQTLFTSLNDRYINSNMAGLILMSDGIYNQGVNPIYLNDQINYPVYSIGVGDTNKVKDGKILAVKSNKIAFLGNDFPIEIDLELEQAKGESLRLTIENSGKEVFKKNIEVETESEIETITTSLQANEIGVQAFTTKLSVMNSERNVVNNEYEFYIDILDGRQNIAILASSPHPDIAAIKRSLAKNENYALTYELFSEFKSKPDEYDLIIMHHAESKLNSKIHHSLFRKIQKIKVPTLLIGSGWSQLDKELGIGNRRNQRSKQNISYPLINNSFSLFHISEELQEQLSKFPPLNSVNIGSSSIPPNSIMLYQKIGAVETRYPLLVFTNKRESKIGRFFGDGLWQWALNDYQENKNHNQFSELLSKTVQYLALKSDRNYFRLDVGSSFLENERIMLDAQLYNQSYELVDDASIELTIIDEAGKEFNFVFSPYKNAYRLIIPSLQAGKYRYKAQTSLDGNDYIEEGSFLVKALQLEQLNNVANHNLLYQLSEKSSGEFFHISEIEKLPKAIEQRKDISSVFYMNESLEEVISLKWIFFALLGLLCLEWFIRKYKGAY